MNLFITSNAIDYQIDILKTYSGFEIYLFDKDHTNLIAYCFLNDDLETCLIDHYSEGEKINFASTNNPDLYFTTKEKQEIEKFEYIGKYLAETHIFYTS